MAREAMLTTIDNPFNPFEDFDSWYQYDESHGYSTCGYLARIAKSSDDISIAEQLLAIEFAIDEIVRLNLLGLYKKVVKDE
jgi:hypothetical protein